MDIKSSRYNPGRALPLFEDACSDHVLRARFYAGVRKAIGNGDLSLIRVEAGRISANNTKLLRKIDEYLVAMRKQYGDLHPGACSVGIREARDVVYEVAKLMGVKMEKRVSKTTTAQAE